MSKNFAYLERRPSKDSMGRCMIDKGDQVRHAIGARKQRESIPLTPTTSTPTGVWYVVPDEFDARVVQVALTE